MTNSEGGLRAPVREIVDWQNEEYWDEKKLDEETRRQFDVCHGCRRCFNLCDSFPKLFDLIDGKSTAILDKMSKCHEKNFKKMTFEVLNYFFRRSFSAAGSS